MTLQRAHIARASGGASLGPTKRPTNGPAKRSSKTRVPREKTSVAVVVSRHDSDGAAEVDR